MKVNGWESLCSSRFSPSLLYCWSNDSKGLCLELWGNCELKFPNRSMNHRKPLTRTIRSSQLRTWSEYSPSKILFILLSLLSFFWHSSRYRRGAHKMNDPANAALKSHEREYLQGAGAFRWTGVALLFLQTNGLSKGGKERPQLFVLSF